MKIYLRNKSARLKYRNKSYSCKRCPFFKISGRCPWGTLTSVDCHDKGYWVDGEYIDIFRL